ncbi:DNA endonuclease [Enterococcus phage EC55P1]|nr:DNA endonuclease [Enterococcus phage EC55P1]
MGKVKEIWEPVKGFPDYSVSNLGRVISRRTSKEKFIGSKAHGFGYKFVNLTNGEDVLRINVHKLVALHFVKDLEPEKLPRYVNHIDGDPLNNRADNLEWCTQSENLQHPNCNRKRSKIVRRISVEDGSVEEFINASVAARSVNGRASAVHAVCNGRIKCNKYLGYFWEFL